MVYLAVSHGALEELVTACQRALQEGACIRFDFKSIGATRNTCSDFDQTTFILVYRYHSRLSSNGCASTVFESQCDFDISRLAIISHQDSKIDSSTECTRNGLIRVSIDNDWIGSDQSYTSDKRNRCNSCTNVCSSTHSSGHITNVI